MNATGPRAMAQELLPLTPEQLTAVNDDLAAATNPAGDQTLGQMMGQEGGFQQGITIQDVSVIRQWLPLVQGGEAANPGLTGVMNELAFGDDTFNREVGNAWVL